MARSPFQGTWIAGIRPTVVQKPDTIVKLNGELDLLGCPSCRKRVDWNKYITSVQTDLNIESCPGSATISMSVPAHSVDDVFYEGEILITEMMEVEIFDKGAFLVEGLPQYYPTFWGMVVDVTTAYSAGVYTINITCADILKWWELCQMNINPAFTGPGGKTQMGRSIFGNVLFGTNPYDMIWTLAQQSFGDVVVGTGSLTSLHKDGQQQKTFNAAFGDMMLYWQDRFSRIRSNLLLYGTRGVAVRGDQLFESYKKQGGYKKFTAQGPGPLASKTVRQANGGDSGSQMVFDPTDPGVTAFRTQFSQAGQVNFWQSEYQTKLQIANACKEAIGFEFYMDVTGDIVFKPPFYNLDILGNKPVSWIQDIDIIDMSEVKSEAEVVTQIQIQGSFGGNVDYGLGEETTPGTSVTDYHLLRKYGWRTHTFSSEFMASPLLMFYTGMDMLDRINTKRNRLTVTIPKRAELRLGFPIYIACLDQVWYIQGISHSTTFGGAATTSLTLTAQRKKFHAPKGIGTIELTSLKGAAVSNSSGEPLKGPKPSSRELAAGGRFKANIGAAESLPPDPNVALQPGQDNPYDTLVLRHPKTGRAVGYPNVVMAYTRPFQAPPESLAKTAGNKTAKEKKATPNKKDIETKAGKIVEDLASKAHQADESDKIREKLVNNRYSYGLNSAGVYTYLHDLSAVIQDVVMLPKSNVDFGTKASKGFEGSTGMIRPVSDERGFEVIGHFRYGRGVSLTDGSLVLNETVENPGAINSRASVQPQLALGGGLQESLMAQSRGLTTAQVYSTNPAQAMLDIAPDIITAGILDPNTKEPTFVETRDNFVDTAPLGSPEQEGGTNKNFQATVEASQLSRALTLTEMHERMAAITGTATDCHCLLGRPELEFMSAGYEFKTLTGNSVVGPVANDEDLDDMQADQLNGYMNERAAAIEAAGVDARRLAEADPSLVNEPDAVRLPEINERVVVAEAKAAATWDAQNPLPGSPGGPLTTGTSPKAVVSVMERVESFMAGLYRNLDQVHQEYEKAVRGDLVPPKMTEEQLRFGTGPNLGKVSPPYGPMGRAVGGDPVAIAQTFDSAVDTLAEDWNQFSDDLQKQTKAAELKAEIQALKIELSAVETEIGLLQQAAAFTFRGADIPPDLANKRDQLIQRIANKEFELATL